ncbi:MAG TPA: nucleoside phosphorylase [Roseiarcus sp.]|jgi:uridine phosphorylase|nr:nucleoside phosphorylase [Roseiarcus sp.]
MPRTAWYIGCSEKEVGEAAILVGDRARIDRIAEHLESPAFVAENRGLRTVTGLRSGIRVTAAAFGMGGPIAAIVLHELFDLGVRTFLRIGTAMVMPPAEVGDFVVADGAYRGEGTSRAYAPLGYPAVADFGLGVALRAALAKRDGRWRAGLFGTYDGFYTEMFALPPGDKRIVEATREKARRLGLIATDMETATILTAGRMLGARVASLCLGTVDGLTQAKIDASELAVRERALIEIALDAVVAELSEDSRSP